MSRADERGVESSVSTVGTRQTPQLPGPLRSCTGSVYELGNIDEALRCATPLVDRNPDIRVLLRLAFHEVVAGRVPGPDFVDQIVEDQIAFVGFHRQDGVAFIVEVVHYGAAPAGGIQPPKEACACRSA